eukprot:s2652_g6.t1
MVLASVPLGAPWCHVTILCFVNGESKTVQLVECVNEIRVSRIQFVSAGQSNPSCHRKPVPKISSWLAAAKSLALAWPKMDVGSARTTQHPALFEAAAQHREPEESLSPAERIVESSHHKVTAVFVLRLGLAANVTPNVGFLSLTLTDQLGIPADRLIALARPVMTFRNFFLFHLKHTKSFLHSRQGIVPCQERAKADEFCAMAVRRSGVAVLLVLAAMQSLYFAMNAFVSAPSQGKQPALRSATRDVSMQFFQQPKEEPAPTPAPEKTGSSLSDFAVFGIGALLILFPFIASGPPPDNEVGDFISQEAKSGIAQGDMF